MAKILFLSPGGDDAPPPELSFESDEPLTEFLHQFADSAAAGDLGIWVGTKRGPWWLPTGTPFVTYFDGDVPDDLLRDLEQYAIDRGPARGER